MFPIVTYKFAFNFRLLLSQILFRFFLKNDEKDSRQQQFKIKCKFALCYNWNHCPIKAVAWSTIAEKDFVTLNKFDKSANVYLLLSSECSLSMCVCIFYSENQCTVSNTVFA